MSFVSVIYRRLMTRQLPANDFHDFLHKYFVQSGVVGCHTCQACGFQKRVDHVQCTSYIPLHWMGESQNTEICCVLDSNVEDKKRLPNQFKVVNTTKLIFAKPISFRMTNQFKVVNTTKIIFGSNYIFQDDFWLILHVSG